MKKSLFFFSIIMAVIASFVSGCSDNKEAIEAVLRADANTGSINLDDAEKYLTSAKSKVQNMRAIDTSKCPKEFQIAYMQHIEAWEKKIAVAEELVDFEDYYGSWPGFLEAFLRGMLFDVFGTYNDAKRAFNKIQEHEKIVNQEIKSTFAKVLEIAVDYGVDVSKYR